MELSIQEEFVLLSNKQSGTLAHIAIFLRSRRAAACTFGRLWSQTLKAHADVQGATWTLPIIGKFADSLNPTMAKYKESWKNDLSVASVFNMYVYDIYSEQDRG